MTKSSAAAACWPSLVGWGRSVLLIAVSDGEASHPGSAYWTRERLRYERPRESLMALRELNVPGLEIVRANLPDGALTQQQTRIAALVHRYAAPRDVLFSTWRNDGHPDHDATGRACAAVAKNLQLPLVEFPVWAWHWAGPEDDSLPWSRARRLTLSSQSIRSKLRAIGRFRSQTQADDTTGADAVVTPATLLRSVQVGEVFFS